jgi:hypothetical protein
LRRDSNPQIQSGNETKKIIVDIQAGKGGRWFGDTPKAFRFCLKPESCCFQLMQTKGMFSQGDKTVGSTRAWTLLPEQMGEISSSRILEL